MTFRLSRPSGLALMFAVAAAMASLAHAVPKPDPPGMNENPTPAQPTEPGEKPDYIDPVEADVTPQEEKAFSDAYKKMERPRLLILIGIDGKAAGIVPKGVQGNTLIGQPNADGVGAVFLDTDSSGVTEQLAAAIGKHLNTDGKTKLIDREVLASKIGALQQKLKNADEAAAIDTIATSVNADYIIYFKFIPRTAEQIREDGMKFACIGELKNVAAATKIPLDPFDFDGLLNNRTALRYGKALTKREVIPAFVRSAAAGNSKDFEITILGLDQDSQARTLRNALKKVDNVEDPQQESFELNSDDEKSLKLTCTFEGDKGDFTDDFVAAAHTAGIELTTITSSGNTYVYRASNGAKPSGTDTGWFYVTQKDSDLQKKFIEMIKKNPGKLAVVVNWVLDPDQRIADTSTTTVQANPWQYTITSAHDPISQLKGDPRLGNVAAGTQTVTLEQIQNTIAELFADTGLFVVDANAVSSALERQRAKLNELSAARKPETDVMTVLKNSEGYDYVVWAKAQIRTVGQLNNENACKYSFTLYDVRSGRLLGSVSWDGTDQQFTKSEIKGVPKRELHESRVSDIVARYIGGTLMCKWMNKPAYVEFEVYGAKELTEVKRFEDAIESRVDSATPFGLAYDNGVGKFTCGFDGSAEAMKAQVEKIAGEYDGRKGKVTEVQANKIIFTFDK